MNHKRINRLIEDEASGRYSRRQILQRAAALGLSAPAVAMLFAGSIPVRALAQDADNPLGVDPAAPLDVVIFKGGFGDDYAIYVNENIYNVLYPDAQITYAGIQRLGEQLQPRFVAGDPPDVIDNSGAGNLDNAALVAEGQLADLADGALLRHRGCDLRRDAGPRHAGLRHLRWHAVPAQLGADGLRHLV